MIKPSIFAAETFFINDSKGYYIFYGKIFMYYIFIYYQSKHSSLTFDLRLPPDRVWDTCFVTEAAAARLYEPQRCYSCFITTICHSSQ